MSVIPQITICWNPFENWSFLEINPRIPPITAITIPIAKSHFPSSGVMNAEAKSGWTTPISPSVAMPVPTRVIVLSQNPTSNNAKITTSIKAVGFAITANPKKRAERIRYFKLCFESVSTPFFWKWLRKIIPPNKARIVSARTPISVLLSTNTRNAPIPLVSHIRRSPRPTRKEVSSVSSEDSFLPKTRSASLSTPSQKINTRIPLKALRLIATVSFAILKKFPRGAQREKKKEMYPCQRYCTPLAGPIFPQRIPAFSAITLGTYIYSWFASQAVEYGIYEWEKLKK